LTIPSKGADDILDSSNEIAILRDRVARAVPTPPSSISVPLSPKQNASHRLSDSDVPRFPASKASQMSPTSNTPEPRNRILTGIPRSNTASSIPSLASPATKRFSSTLPQSPSGIAGLARSTTSRNLAAVAAPGSPAMLRSRSALSAPSPARSAAVNSSLAAKTKGFKLLHELQARLKATDDKLGTRMAKRNVSAPVPPAASLRTFSSATTSSAPQRVAHARVTALTKESTPIADQSGATLLSPNGWVLISESEETPTNQATGIPQYEPASPLESNFRPTSSTGSRGLPARPGIPSPLASFNTQLSQSSNSCSAHRPPSRASALGSSTMTPLKTDDENDSRPMSPSMRSQPSGSLMRSASPASGSASMPSSRPPSRQGGRDKPGGRIQHHVLGRGPPPSSPGFLKPLAISVSSSSPAAGLRRSARRSSLGVAEASLPPSGIPAPRGTANRPISLPVFGNSTPPPVPRIPSAHMRESVKRNGMLGASGRRERDRLKSAAE